MRRDPERALGVPGNPWLTGTHSCGSRAHESGSGIFSCASTAAEVMGQAATGRGRRRRATTNATTGRRLWNKSRVAAADEQAEDGEGAAPPLRPASAVLAELRRPAATGLQERREGRGREKEGIRTAG